MTLNQNVIKIRLCLIKLAEFSPICEPTLSEYLDNYFETFEFSILCWQLFHLYFFTVSWGFHIEQVDITPITIRKREFKTRQNLFKYLSVNFSCRRDKEGFISNISMF